MSSTADRFLYTPPTPVVSKTHYDNIPSASQHMDTTSHFLTIRCRPPRKPLLSVPNFSPASLRCLNVSNSYGKVNDPLSSVAPMVLSSSPHIHLTASYSRSNQCDEVSQRTSATAPSLCSSLNSQYPKATNVFTQNTGEPSPLQPVRSTQQREPLFSCSSSDICCKPFHISHQQVFSGVANVHGDVNYYSPLNMVKHGIQRSKRLTSNEQVRTHVNLTSPQERLVNEDYLHPKGRMVCYDLPGLKLKASDNTPVRVPHVYKSKLLSTATNDIMKTPTQRLMSISSPLSCSTRCSSVSSFSVKSGAVSSRAKRIEKAFHTKTAFYDKLQTHPNVSASFSKPAHKNTETPLRNMVGEHLKVEADGQTRHPGRCVYCSNDFSFKEHAQTSGTLRPDGTGNRFSPSCFCPCHACDHRLLSERLQEYAYNSDTSALASERAQQVTSGRTRVACVSECNAMMSNGIPTGAVASLQPNTEVQSSQQLFQSPTVIEKDRSCTSTFKNIQRKRKSDDRVIRGIVIDRRLKRRLQKTTPECLKYTFRDPCYLDTSEDCTGNQVEENTNRTVISMRLKSTAHLCHNDILGSRQRLTSKEVQLSHGQGREYTREVESKRSSHIDRGIKKGSRSPFAFTSDKSGTADEKSINIKPYRDTADLPPLSCFGEPVNLVRKQGNGSRSYLHDTKSPRLPTKISDPLKRSYGSYLIDTKHLRTPGSIKEEPKCLNIPVLPNESCSTYCMSSSCHCYDKKESIDVTRTASACQRGEVLGALVWSTETSNYEGCDKETKATRKISSSNPLTAVGKDIGPNITDVLLPPIHSLNKANVSVSQFPFRDAATRQSLVIQQDKLCCCGVHENSGLNVAQTSHSMRHGNGAYNVNSFCTNQLNVESYERLMKERQDQERGGYEISRSSQLSKGSVSTCETNGSRNHNGESANFKGEDTKKLSVEYASNQCCSLNVCSPCVVVRDQRTTQSNETGILTPFEFTCIPIRQTEQPVDTKPVLNVLQQMAASNLNTDVNHEANLKNASVCNWQFWSRLSRLKCLKSPERRSYLVRVTIWFTIGLLITGSIAAVLTFSILHRKRMEAQPTVGQYNEILDLSSLNEKFSNDLFISSRRML